jgi:hypothetical protein
MSWWPKSDALSARVSGVRKKNEGKLFRQVDTPVHRAARGGDAGGGRTVKQHAVDVDIAADGQIGPLAQPRR